MIFKGLLQLQNKHTYKEVIWLWRLGLVVKSISAKNVKHNNDQSV